MAGCGGSSRPKVAGGVCTLKAIDAVAGSLGVAPAHVTDKRGTGSNASPQCTFRTRTAHGTRVEVIANVETAPSAYFIVERTIVEASQIFGPRRLAPAPVSVSKLGLEASWFPEEQWLISTDGARVITTSVDWSGASQAQKIALARKVTVLYLHTPRGKKAIAVAKGYPSG